MKRGEMMAGLILVSAALLTTSAGVTRESTDPYVRETFSDPSNNGAFNHLVVDGTTGKVYIGAVNRLYQLSEGLAEQKTVDTGPRDDHPECHPETQCTKYVKYPTDSISKALVIDRHHNRLIACSNLYLGFCEKRTLSDITIADEPIYETLVPNDATSSVYMFIAPGPITVPTDDNERPEVLYVGATYSTAISVYSDFLYAVSSKKLTDFELASNEVAGRTKIEIEKSQRDTFRVNYLYGFSSQDFSYFLAVQGEALDSTTLVTRILRVCQDDKFFRSYAEVPLECNLELPNRTVQYRKLLAAHLAHPGALLAQDLGLPDLQPLTDDDRVLFATFEKSQDSVDTNSPASVLCVFPLPEIKRKFTQNIQQCFKGVGNTGPAHLTIMKTCKKLNIEQAIGDDYCGTYDLNYPISGSSGTIGQALIQFADVTTSLAVTSVEDYTVAFVGTSEGILRKVMIETGERAAIYGSHVKGTTPINADMAFDRTKTHVYVVSEKEVALMRVERCDLYLTCSECLQARDPYCGWCSLQNKCSTKSNCENNEAVLWWLSPYKGVSCPRILQVEPQQVQIHDRIHQLELTVQNLPTPLTGEYECMFSGEGMTSRSTQARLVGTPNQTNNSIICETPERNLVPRIPTGKDHINMNLSILLGQKDFVSTNFTFFDCELHQSCTSCTNSDFPCTWCVQHNKCTFQREICGDDIMITGKKVPGDTDYAGPQTCPRIEGRFPEILVPEGFEKSISVLAVHLQDFQTQFKCEFHLTPSPISVPAEKTAKNHIRCDTYQFAYSGHSPDRNVPFTIKWSSEESDMWNPLDNPDNIQVSVYQCSAMASHCGSCLTQDSKYNCGWCKQSSQRGPQCTDHRDCNGGWLNNTQVCPNPIITSFFPKIGPTEGGTLITMNGENLGKMFDDIKSGITVAGEPCVPIEELYEAATTIVCETGPTSKATKGPVQVSVSNRYSNISKDTFSYVKPLISYFTPIRGPKSGGTRLTIHGSDLDAGINQRVLVANSPCNIIPNSLSSDMVVCLTSAKNSTVRGPVAMKFDQLTTAMSFEEYSYEHDPNITDILPKSGIDSGGTRLIVKGSNLDIVQQPQIVVYKDNKNYTNECRIISSELLYCFAPGFDTPLLRVRRSNNEYVATKLSFGFIMDNVSSVVNMTSREGWQFSLYPNPIIHPFEEGSKSFQIKEGEEEQYLTIKGNYLNVAADKYDYKVLVGPGDQECEVAEIALENIFCRPPVPEDDRADSKDEVVVYVGNYSILVGDLQYEMSDFLSFTHPLIIGICICVLFLLIIIIIIFIAYKRKSKESDLKVKRMQNQMDVLEARVAKECKEAFAELQTDITEMTNDISGGTMSIPFRSFRSFCMRVLFPNIPEDEHAVARDLEVDRDHLESIENGLRLFGQLMGNKTFVLLFIRTLEQHKTFSMRERVDVASLVSVALQNKMEYHTEILKILLGDLIEKAIEGRSHPKLLLRRTESVAEKMLTNWFTFMLYRFLKECAGEPLFLLYKAMKQQVDKGPVDALTSEARYSLSEDKLIRQQIEYKQLTIHVSFHVNNGQVMKHPVKVLDCDIIPQVKEKILDAIYKSSPFSSRPSRDEMDLEWRQGRQGRLLLQAQDSTTKQEGDYRRYNTLAHYKVPDGALMALIPIQHSLSSLSPVSDQGSRYRFDMQTGSPSLSRSISPHTLNPQDIENGAKIYHLVKRHDVDVQKDSDRSSKMVSEVYLTRLLATKGTLQQFVDDLFETIFSTTNRSSALPLAIKYMFDFLDDQALHHGITDPEVVHTWKSNSLPLRFWVNVVKNPDFVFDINKSNIVDSCLSVVAQTFMDSCSMSENKLSKDSPSSKLLYAKDIPKYKKWVERYYQDIKLMPAISDQDMNSMLVEETRANENVFNINAALYELYRYVAKYSDEIMNTLEDDEFARNHRLPYRLEQVMRTLGCLESEA